MIYSAGMLDAVHRWTSEDFDRMVEAGALEGVPVELIDGLIVDVTPQGTEHAAMIRALQWMLGAAGGELNIQMPLACADGWTPEPDVMLTPNPGPRAHPTTARLVVEVMVNAHAEARRKLPGYALAGVPEVWLVDVPARAVEVHPAGRVLRGDDVLDPAVDGITPFTVAALFARAGL